MLKRIIIALLLFSVPTSLCAQHTQGEMYYIKKKKKSVGSAGGGGGGNPAFVQSASHNITTATSTLTVGNGTGSGWSSGAVSSGDLLFTAFVSFNPSTLSATDSLGTSFTCAILGAFNSFYIGYCWGKTTTSGADTITMTSGLTLTPTIVAMEFKNLTVATDGTASGNGPASCSSCTLPGITTANANDVIIGCGGTNSTNITYTAGTSFTIPTNGQVSGGGQSSVCEYQIVSSATTYTPAISLSAATTIIGGTFAFK